jgi:WD40 repeat protein
MNHEGCLFHPTIRVWSLETGKVIHELPAPPEGSWSVAWSPDGKVLASGGEDAIVRIWDRDSGREIGTFKGHAGQVTSLAFTPDGKRLLSGSSDTTILVWDMAKLGRASVNPPK